MPAHAAAQTEGVGAGPGIIGKAFGQVAHRLPAAVVFHQAGEDQVGELVVVVEQRIDGALVFPGVHQGVGQVRLGQGCAEGQQREREQQGNGFFIGTGPPLLSSGFGTEETAGGEGYRMRLLRAFSLRR